MPLRRLAAIAVLGLGIASAPLSANVLASAGSNHPQGLTVTAARPGIELVAPGPGHISPQADHAVRRALTTGEGAGSGFCRAHKGYALGASLDGVFACGPSTGTADDFDSVGFQCVELSERYLWVVYQDFIPDVPSGKELVSMGHSVLGLPVGEPATGVLPAAGDVVSLWGGPKAQPYGHTAVVSSVNVDSNGNGTIGLMEENGAGSGWDQINVADWKETFGDPSWGGGVYYYNHVQWLELQPPPPTLFGSAIQFAVQGLGRNSVASSVNDTGTVTGYINHQAGGSSGWTQPFVLGAGSWSYPAGPSTKTRLTAINDHGAIAAWSWKQETGAKGYAVHSGKTFRWSALPMPTNAVTGGKITSIDKSGDISAWVTLAGPAQPSESLIWTHEQTGYQLRTLPANRYFSRPLVTSTDHYGDATGTEMLGTAKTYAIVWAPWGKAYRLPGLSGPSIDSAANAMLVRWKNGSRNLIVVGSSVDALGLSQAVEWTVTIGSNTVQSSLPTPLAGSNWTGPSVALAINPYGWITGSLNSTGRTGRAFLWRPSTGMVDLASLLPTGSPWVIQSVAGINAGGQILGRGYDYAVPALDSSRGILLTPQALPTTSGTGKSSMIEDTASN